MPVYGYLARHDDSLINNHDPGRVCHALGQGRRRRDPEKEKHLVMIHGYNNTVDDARTRYNEIWRRLFWLGFRGQFIGVTWHGDVGVWNTGFLSGATYDSSTQNAFKTSQGVMAFLHNMHNWAGGVQNIDVMAHSLGNLVVWDAMRLHQTTGQGAGNPLFRNLISVEAAVWPETFWNEATLSYQSETNRNNHITYSINELKQHSWSFWFNQEAHPAQNSLAGQLYHSFVPDDEAIEKWMRYNDNLMRGSIASIFPIARKWHYSRHKLTSDPPEWRSPEGTKDSDAGWGMEQAGKPVISTFPSRIPTLMQQGHRKPYYGYKDINLPVGAMEHPLNPRNSKNAKTLGWRKGKHSDFAVGESGDANEEMWFQKIWNWYDQFLRSAITIGEE